MQAVSIDTTQKSIDSIEIVMNPKEKIEIDELSIKDINNPSFTLDANGAIANDEAIDFSFFF